MALAPAGVEEPLDATFALCRQLRPEVRAIVMGRRVPSGIQSIIRSREKLAR